MWGRRDFIAPSNAGEDFCGSDIDDVTYDISGSGFDDATSDMQLQLGGERREKVISQRGSSHVEERDFALNMRRPPRRYI